MLDKSEVLYFENCIDKLNSKSKNALLDVIYMNKKEMVLSVHKNKITQLNGKDKRWHTYIPADTPKGLKEIKRPTEKEMIDFLLDFYGLNGMTFSQLFDEWLPYKATITNSSGTIRRHCQHFQKYFVKENSKLLHMNIAKIDKLLLQSECNRLIKKYNMSQTEWKNVKTIIRGMFEYAYDKKIIRENPCDRLKITVKFKQINKKPSETQVYKTQEYQNIHEYLDCMYSEENDSVYLAVKFQFFTGMRVGELVALRWEDVDQESFKLHIHSEESDQPYLDQNGKWHSKRVVVPHTKTNTDRTLQLLPKAIEVIKKLPQGQEFLFMRGNERITERQVNYVLEKYAERMGVLTKSSHKLRKTYASRLDAAGVPLDVIQRDLGHRSAKTTLTYFYNPLEDHETYDLKAQAI